MKRKFVSVLILVTMVMTLISGCSKKAPIEGTSGSDTPAATSAPEATAAPETSTINFDEEPYTVNFPVLTFGDSPADLQLVEDAINKEILPKINAKIKLDVINAMDMMNTYTLRASSGEKMDIMLLAPFSQTLQPLVSSNMVLSMNDLLAEWGQGIQTNLGDTLKVGQINNNQYTLPGIDGSGTTRAGLEFNVELVKKYDLVDEIQNIKTLADLEPILATIKEKEPEVIPYYSSNAGIGFTQLLGGFDTLGDGYGVIENGSANPLTIVDKYESAKFMNDCKLMHDWYVKGYISKDTLTSQNTGHDLIQAGKVFCIINTYNVKGDNGMDVNNPTDGMIEWAIPDVKAVKGTGSVSSFGYSISATCERPDKAMQLLNLFYTDSETLMLLNKGIEGKNYTMTADGLIETIPDSGYNLILEIISDYKIIPSTAQLGADFKAEAEAYDKASEVSPAFGFVFDSTQYANEIAACNAVKDEFYNVLDCGAVDPTVEIPNFVAKLKASGLDTIMKAKQEQLDQWVASQAK